jgi:hypothetical protein
MWGDHFCAEMFKDAPIYVNFAIIQVIWSKR